MILSDAGLFDREAWRKKGYHLPSYDRAEMISRTKKEPIWLHFGAGNVFRAFQANAAERLLNKGLLNRGIIVAEGYDGEIIDKVYLPYDNLSILVTLKANGGVEKSVIASVAESCHFDSESVGELSRLKEIFSAASLQMATFTITEKGYSLRNSRGEYFTNVIADFKNGPEKSESYIGLVTSLLYARYKAGELPLAMVSMDNCSQNGDKLLSAVRTFAEAWVKNGFVPRGFLEYILNEKKIAFPWTMIDKITPRPNPSIEKLLREDGVELPRATVTTQKTYIAPFVNAEECEYLILEDSFPNGRPCLEKSGFLFTTRETVSLAERMKVCTCLNPLHTALAVFGCVLGYDLIADEMKDEVLKRLVEGIGYDEGLPVATNPEVLSPRDFLDTVINVRLPNPFMPDTPQRIATDTSQKLPIRYGETIKAYLASDVLDIKSLKLIPLVFAGWLRYLMGVDDKGRHFELSPDPLLPALCPAFEGIVLGSTDGVEEALLPILRRREIFGVDLTEIGMDETVLRYFKKMIAGKGAVYTVLKNVLGMGRPQK